MHLGILLSHPIQYYAEWFRGLAQHVDLDVFFAHRQTPEQQGQAGFGLPISWDSDLLSGYRHTFLQNRASLPSPDRFAGCDTPEIAFRIRMGSFDGFLVPGWYLKSFRQAIRACRTHSVPIFVRGDSHLGTPRSRLKRWLKRFTHPALLRKFDAFFYVGKRNAEYLRYYGANMSRMFFVPHFVDNRWFATRATEASTQINAQHKAWAADNDTLVALFVGKFLPIKRPADLLQGIALLNNSGRKGIAVFAGSGPLEPALRKEADRLRVPAYFEGFKNQSELPKYYASADVLVLPSESETWGLVVNEAMACGLPAIVSDTVGCGPDLIDEGETGFSFCKGNAIHLAQRLSLLYDRIRAGHSFASATVRKMQTYSVETAVNQTISAFSTLCAQN